MTRVKELPKYQQPREKLARYGTERMADHELLAILLGTGFKGVNVVELSKRVLKLLSSMGKNELTLEKLVEVKGLGSTKASKVIAALELGRRMYSAIPETPLTPEKVFEECRDIRDSKKEHFVVFYLNTRDVSIARELISVGVLDASLVHAREVFEPALRYAASSLVIAHNHPSGNTEPSDEDIEITKKLIHAGKLLDLRVVDHVIVSKNSWSSLRSKEIDGLF